MMNQVPMAGARHSAADREHFRAIHDAAVALGATCDGTCSFAEPAAGSRGTGEAAGAPMAFAADPDEGRLSDDERRHLLGATWAGRGALKRLGAAAPATFASSDEDEYRRLLAATPAGQAALKRRDARGGAGR